MSLGFEQHQQMHPALLAVHGAEVYENLISGGRFFSEKYGRMSERCQAYQYNYILVTGPNGAGKTETGMGLRRVMLADEGLKDYDIVSLPFALFADVARYKNKIRSEARHGEYTSEEYSVITHEMFKLTDEMKYQDPSRQRIFIYEMSTPSVYPHIEDLRSLPWNISKGPVPVRGAPGHLVRDRGHSAGYTWALSREKEAVQMIVVERSKGVRKVAQQVRDPQNEDILKNLKDKGFTPLLEDIEGMPVDLASIDDEAYKDLNSLLGITFAPADTIAKSDEELVAVRASIPFTNIPTERSWYLWLAEELGMDEKRFSIVQNERLDDTVEKGIDIGYFVHSGVYQMYPHLLSPSIRRLIKAA